jgi:hypothetical protein
MFSSAHGGSIKKDYTITLMRVGHVGEIYSKTVGVQCPTGFIKVDKPLVLPNGENANTGILFDFTVATKGLVWTFESSCIGAE